MTLLIGVVAFAHPGPHDDDDDHDDHDHMPAAAVGVRQWALESPVVRTETGSLVAARENWVQLRRSDDSLVSIPVKDLSQEDRDYLKLRIQAIEHIAMAPYLLAQINPANQDSQTTAEEAPSIAAHFDPFVRMQAIRTRWNDQFFFVESNGIPAHPMMIGIRSWQQQVPIPQRYFGDNAWRVPLHPAPAKTPATTKNRFLRGAIAIAVNGVPIFNPLNNRGDDAFLFGELDEYGGHCGRADDYHYHLAPVHLEKIVGQGQPIAYALDGYPIYGYQDHEGADAGPLDALNGHEDAAGHYHYHATKTYPYLNGGFHGQVVEKDGQVDPQPRAQPVRPALTPLRDAVITDFQETKSGSYQLTYTIKGKVGTVSYDLSGDGKAKFIFLDTSGKKTEEIYSSKNGRDPGPRSLPPPYATDQPTNAPVNRQEPTSRRPKLTVKSDSTDDKGLLSIDCTCDGKAESPAVSWQDAPRDAKAFAVSLWHTAPDKEKSYWVIYNIPAEIHGLRQNEKGFGTLGLNDRRRAEYDPMCSKGPGLKTYHLTVFALAKPVDLKGTAATRENLLKAIKDVTIAEGTLDFKYERKGK